MAESVAILRRCHEYELIAQQHHTGGCWKRKETDSRAYPDEVVCEPAGFAACLPQGSGTLPEI